MMKHLLSIAVLLLTLSGLVGAQWVYDSDFYEGAAPHGVTVAPDGNVWISQFSQNDTLSLFPDTLTASGLIVLDQNGVAASFSPVSTFTIDGNADTLRFNNRGIGLDHNGNILTGSGYLYRINYQTGEGMARYDFLDDIQALTEAAVDDNGFVYVTRVVPGGDPIVVLDENLDLYNFAVDSNFTISRTMLASADGKDLYVGAIYPGVGVIHYRSEDGPDGVYAIEDTIVGPNPDKELWGQILDWDPNDMMWVGTYWDVAVGSYQGWYALDPRNSFTFVDSLGSNAGPPVTGVVPAGGTFNAPRGVAFWEENDGSWTAYTADFDGSIVKKWTNANPATGIIVVDNGDVMVRDFNLRQNYPNPFNPTTTIPFSLQKRAHVELKIYNTVGQEVATLVSETMNQGTYEYQFNGADLSSGVYFYRIKFDGKVQSRRMILTK